MHGPGLVKCEIYENPSYHACSNEGDYRGAPRVVTTVDTAHGRFGKQQYAQSEWGIPARTSACKIQNTKQPQSTWRWGPTQRLRGGR
jgi:hypothetical protein